MQKIKIDREKYLAEIKRVETALKALYVKRHESGYETSFDHRAWHKLQAEATRLYAFRTSFRQSKHPIGGAHYLQSVKWAKEPMVYGFYSEKWLETEKFPHLKALILSEEEATARVLEGVPGWSADLLKTYEAAGPAEAATATA